MRGYRKSWYGNRHGIYYIATYSQQQTVMFLKKDIGEIPLCISRAEASYYENNRPHILMNCYDALMQNDAREIYFLDELFVKQWADWSCMAP